MNIHPILRHIDPEAVARDALEFVRVKSETGREGDGSRFFADLLRRDGLYARLHNMQFATDVVAKSP